MSIFGANGGASASARLHYYSFGDGMTTSQITAYDSILSSYLTAVGRI
jgi:hypothetical protein